ncbi:hypothetical protein [Burkholderia lata]|uniref:hypothetical protein n=1 Tax=Burkholderia lata (strain ATCC 17760 / DSM 23089 / LMG 22485 / NCIMB 9086 / R18194 / 383) TaxID=482957 RepID=UPI0012FDD1E0|nr:hypothetical protein [Burkholderia lata]
MLSQVERGPVSSSLTSLVGIARAWNVTMQCFFEMPSKKRSVPRGDPLEFFGFADSAPLFVRILACLPVGNTRSGIIAQGASSFARPAVPYGWSGNESKAAACVQVGAPRWF